MISCQDTLILKGPFRKFTLLNIVKKTSRYVNALERLQNSRENTLLSRLEVKDLPSDSFYPCPMILGCLDSALFCLK